LDELLKSTFWEMFGDPVRNEKKWNKKSLGEILRVKHGYAFKSDFFKKSGEYVLLTPGNFYEKSGYRDRGEKQKYYIGEIPEEYLLKKGNMLVAMTEQAPGLLGSPIIVPESNKFLHNQRLGLIVPRKENIQTLFLFHLFNTVTIRRKIHSKATGTKVRHTSPTKIEEITVGCPPLNLQNQFAQIVQKAESLKTIYQSSLQELETLYASLTQRAFRGKLDLNEIPVVLSGKAEIATKQETIQPELEIKPKTKKKEVDKEQKQLAKKLNQIIKKRFQTSFTFNELWDEFTDQYPIDTDAIESESEVQKAKLKRYEAIKSIVYEWLDAKKPFLFQVFDEKRKEMVLKPTI